MDRASRRNTIGTVLLSVIAFLAIGAIAQTAPSLEYEANNPTSNQTFSDIYQALSGNGTVDVNNDGSQLQLLLDSTSSVAFGSLSNYSFGYISIQLKLCPGDSAGTVTAFYMSSDGYQHDEFDFEFLGNVSGEYYLLQTNMFVNGVGNREMRHTLWFDPTVDYHVYNLLWNNYMVAFYVDNVPIRVFLNYSSQGVAYPTKPVGIYCSLWDGSDWATQGGKYKLDLQYAPFVVQARAFGAVDACVPDASTSVAQCEDPNNPAWWNQPQYLSLTNDTLSMLTFMREAFCIYDYCKDTARFATTGMPPECALRNW